jgi:hypothetical protein
MMVFYRDGVTHIQLGDQVELNGGFLFLFRKLIGQVVYVPGVSALRPAMEFGGLQWIAVDIPGKALIKHLIDSDTGRLLKDVRLLRRGAATVNEADNLQLDLESDN